jgi:hypothetical protein
LTVNITTHQQFIRELAEAAILLHEGGQHAPTAPEIADSYWPGTAGMPKVFVEEVRRRLPEIRKALHDMGHSVAPVAERYYRLARRHELDYQQIGECLAVGRGKTQAGILFVTESDDLSKWIKARYETWCHGTGVGKLSANAERVALMLEENLITQGEAMAITGQTLYPEDDDYGLAELEE